MVDLQFDRKLFKGIEIGKKQFITSVHMVSIINSVLSGQTWIGSGGQPVITGRINYGHLHHLGTN